MKRFLTIITLGLMLTSCAVPKPTYQYKKTANKPKIQKTINKNFDSIWNKVIDYSSKSFFSIDNFEKDSGLITLNFSGDPAGYIECGEFSYNGFISNMTNVKNYSGTFQEFAKKYYGANLNGRMNILVKQVNQNETFVRANTRYVFSFNRPNPRGSYYARDTQTWTFNGGQEVSNNLIFGAMDISFAVSEGINITCQSTYKLEKELLSILN